MEDLTELEQVEEPEAYPVDDSLLFCYGQESEHTKLIKGPNIREMPVKGPLDADIRARVVPLRSSETETISSVPLSVSRRAFT